MRISNRSHMCPNCVVGAFPRSRSLSVGSRLKPRMETAIHLHQVAKVLPPFPALPVRFPSSHAAPQPLR
jgi:hypothetical protein